MTNKLLQKFYKISNQHAFLPVTHFCHKIIFFFFLFYLIIFQIRENEMDCWPPKNGESSTAAQKYSERSSTCDSSNRVIMLQGLDPNSTQSRIKVNVLIYLFTFLFFFFLLLSKVFHFIVIFINKIFLFFFFFIIFRKLSKIMV